MAMEVCGPPTTTLLPADKRPIVPLAYTYRQILHDSHWCASWIPDYYQSDLHHTPILPEAMILFLCQRGRLHTYILASYI